MKLFGAYLPIFLAIGLAIALLECEAERRGGGGKWGKKYLFWLVNNLKVILNGTLWFDEKKRENDKNGA